MAKRKIAALSRKKIEESDFVGIAKEMRHASDRTAVIVLGAWVEREVEQSILNVLPRHDESTAGKLLESEGALSSFYGKIHLGFALGVYDETIRDNLDIVRRVRNPFAHSPQAISFDTEEVESEIAKLILTTPIELSDIEEFSANRQKFTLACVEIMMLLRLHPIAKKMKLMGGLIDALRSRVGAEGEEYAAEIAKALSNAAEAIEKLKS